MRRGLGDTQSASARRRQVGVALLGDIAFLPRGYSAPWGLASGHVRGWRGRVTGSWGGDGGPGCGSGNVQRGTCRRRL